MKINVLATGIFEMETKKAQTVKIYIELKEFLDNEFSANQNDYVRIRNGLKITMRSELDGKQLEANCWLMEYNDVFKKPANLPADIVATVGRIGLTQANYQRFIEQVKKVEQHSEWQKLQDAERKAAAVEKDYQEHVKRVENMMTLNGKTY